MSTDTQPQTGEQVNPKLPSVRFAERGDVTAAEAVGVEGPDARGGYLVYVLHPQGGRGHITWEPTKELADITASDLQGVLTAWAKLDWSGPRTGHHWEFQHGEPYWADENGDELAAIEVMPVPGATDHIHREAEAALWRAVRQSVAVQGTDRGPQGGGDWVTDDEGRLDDGFGDPR